VLVTFKASVDIHRSKMPHMCVFFEKKIEVFLWNSS
jgi:hypothetical protein